MFSSAVTELLDLKSIYCRQDMCTYIHAWKKPNRESEWDKAGY